MAYTDWQRFDKTILKLISIEFTTKLKPLSMIEDKSTKTYFQFI